MGGSCCEFAEAAAASDEGCMRFDFPPPSHDNDVVLLFLALIIALGLILAGYLIWF